MPQERVARHPAPAPEHLATPPAAPFVLDGIQRNVVRLKPLPLPDRLEVTFSPTGQRVAILTEDGEVTSLLAQTLLSQGWRVVILELADQSANQFSQSKSQDGPPRFKLQDSSEEHLVQQLQTIMQQCGADSIGAFIHVHPKFQSGLSGAEWHYSEVERSMVKQVFFIAKHLKSFLHQTSEPTWFYTIARLDGRFGFSYQTDFGAIGGGLFGLTKTLKMEWPNVNCRAIDLSQTLSAHQAANCIVAELFDPDRTVAEVAYGSQGRVTLEV